MKLTFGLGILRGEIRNGKINAIVENLRMSVNKMDVDIEVIENFLLDHDYSFSKNKHGLICFTKNLFDNKLKEYLNDIRMSQSSVAKKLGVTRSYINQLCAAKNLELDTAYRVLFALNLKPCDIDKIFPAKNTDMLF